MKLREPLTRIGVDIEVEIPEHRAHGFGAEQQGFLGPARMKDAVGKDVAAIFVFRELDLVDGEEFDALLHRHRFHGADPVPRSGRLYTLFTRDEGNGAFALGLDDTVIHLAREQAERQADHAAGMAHHALDRVVRLTGICRPENGLQGTHGPCTCQKRGKGPNEVALSPAEDKAQVHPWSGRRTAPPMRPCAQAGHSQTRGRAPVREQSGSHWPVRPGPR